MTPEQIDLVRRTFALVADDADGLACRFYANLFAAAPGVRPMFPDDLTHQRAKLVRELSVIVAGVARPERLVERLQGLGARHASYGAEAGHYPVVGTVLIGTLAEVLGDEFTDDVRDAWVAAYTLVARVMLDAGERAVADGRATADALVGAVPV